MGGIEKLIAKLSHAKGLVSAKELERVILNYGYTWSRTQGSHTHFRRKLGDQLINFPVHNGKVKHIYVREVIKILTSLS